MTRRILWLRGRGELYHVRCGGDVNRRLLFLAVAVVVVGAAIGFNVWSRRDDGPHVAAVHLETPEPSMRLISPPPPDPMRKPLLLAITDSVGLVANGSQAGKTYPVLIAEQMGWRSAADTASGRGFLPSVIGGVTVPPFSQNLPAVRAISPDPYCVIIDGGRNDVGKDQDAAIAAMNRFYDDVRAAYPRAKIFAVVPLRIVPAQLVGDGSIDTYQRWAREVQAAGERIGAHVIDAKAEHWYDGVDVASMLWTDGIHPNARGEAFYADKVLADMKASGDL